MERNPEAVLCGLTERDPRYRADAYRFIFEALGHTLKHLGRKGGHVTGRELLEGIRLYALEQFGGLAPMVFAGWGVTSTEDFGEIVFNLVGAGLMGKTDHDSKEDFRNAYDFADAFQIRSAPRSPGAQRAH